MGVSLTPFARFRQVSLGQTVGGTSTFAGDSFGGELKQFAFTLSTNGTATLRAWTNGVLHAAATNTGPAFAVCSKDGLYNLNLAHLAWGNRSRIIDVFNPMYADWVMTDGEIERNVIPVTAAQARKYGVGSALVR